MMCLVNITSDDKVLIFALWADKGWGARKW